MMKVLCFSSDKDAHYISQWQGIFQELELEAVLFRLDDDWEQNSELFPSLFHSLYFLIVVTEPVIKAGWFSFLTGLCLGRNCRLFLYLGEPEPELPPYLTAVACGKNSDDLKNYLIHTIGQNKKSLLVTAAQQELSRLGIYFTPEHFFLCIQKNNVRAVELFLKAGFSPDATTDKGIPALCLAARLGFNEICFLLLDNKCDFNAISPDNGNNALMEAAAHHNPELLKKLVELGSDLDVQSKNKQTALMLAVGRGVTETVNLLLQAKANTEYRDILGMTAEQYAKTFKYEQILSLFSKYKNS